VKEVTEEKITKYLTITEKALSVLKVLPPEGSTLQKVAEDLLMMATSYFNDARYYKEKEDYVTAFACVNYAHGYIDAGVRMGLFLGDGSELFAFEPKN
jgi:hypothetical protein